MVFVCLMCASLSQGQDQTSATPPANDMMAKHIEDMELEIKELRAEIATLKGSVEKPAAEGAPAVSGAPAVPAQNLVSGNTTAPGTPTGPSLAGLLGPTSLSGFVDVYYSQNFNNPDNQANSLRFFDGATNQFGLNLVELVVDKAPDPSNSRTGYHVALGFGQAM